MIDQLNSKILLMDGKLHTYYSVDYATYKGVDKTDDNIYSKFPTENLNSIREGLRSPFNRRKYRFNCIYTLNYIKYREKFVLFIYIV